MRLLKFQTNVDSAVWIYKNLLHLEKHKLTQVAVEGIIDGVTGLMQYHLSVLYIAVEGIIDGVTGLMQYHLSVLYIYITIFSAFLVLT